MHSNLQSRAKSSVILMASGSPRRQELLQQIGVQFELVDHRVDEQLIKGEQPEEFVTRLALAKAISVVDHPLALEHPLILGADTVVVCDGNILGKPTDRQDALRMLGMLSNRIHQVHTAVALVEGDRQAVCLSSSEVEFRGLSDDELDAYWQSGEPRGKAGAYAIQGLAAVFVRRLHGSYSGVMGLPLFETAELLNQFGVPCWQSREQVRGGPQ